jgi:hypothetical protein
MRYRIEMVACAAAATAMLQEGSSCRRSIDIDRGERWLWWSRRERAQMRDEH